MVTKMVGDVYTLQTVSIQLAHVIQVLKQLDETLQRIAALLEVMYAAGGNHRPESQ